MATKRADHVVLPELYAVLAAVEADVVETIEPYSIVRRLRHADRMLGDAVA